MTISTTDRLAGPFSGDGSTVEFAFDFAVLDAEHLHVVLSDGADEQVLVAGQDYEVELNEDGPGGLVTLAAPLAEGETLVITTAAPAVQSEAFAETLRHGFRPR